MEDTRVYDNNGHAVWTDTELRKLIDGIQSGLLISQIDLPGRSQKSKASKASRLGLRSRSRRTAAPKAKMRPCIRCRRQMRSEHAGHRMCVACLGAVDQYAYQCI